MRVFKGILCETERCCVPIPIEGHFKIGGASSNNPVGSSFRKKITYYRQQVMSSSHGAVHDWFWTTIALGFSIVAGMGIWFFTPTFTASEEPWYAEGGYYTYSLFLAGVLASILGPRRLWVPPLGVYLGQLLYGVFLYQPSGTSLWPLGMVLAVFYSVATLAGALAGALGMWMLRIFLGLLQFTVRRFRRRSRVA